MRVAILIVIWLVVAVLFGVVGLAIGKGKGRPGAGFWLGFTFGPIGLVIIAVLDRTPEAEARHQTAVRGVLQPTAHTSPARRAHFSEMREAAAGDPEADAIAEAISRAEQEHWGERQPTSWFFADGYYRAVIHMDGRLRAASGLQYEDLLRPGVPRDVTYAATESGSVVWVRIGSRNFENPRPAKKVAAFLERTGGRQIEELSDLTSSVPSAVAEPKEGPLATSVRDALVELDQLKSDGLVTTDEYETKRAEILRRL
jgi:hypothetical protein